MNIVLHQQSQMHIAAYCLKERRQICNFVVHSRLLRPTFYVKLSDTSPKHTQKLAHFKMFHWSNDLTRHIRSFMVCPLKRRKLCNSSRIETFSISFLIILHTPVRQKTKSSPTSTTCFFLLSIQHHINFWIALSIENCYNFTIIK